MSEEMEIEGSSSLQSSSDANAYVAVTGTNIPIVTISTHTEKDQKPAKLPKLPSSRYRYTVWHELHNNEIKGDELNNPRVRRGPEVKDKIFYSIKDQQGRQLHHGKKGQEKKDYEKRIENWENSLMVNLSYQELGHRYQVENFMRILRRLIRAEKIQLVNDDLEDLSKVSFPSCTVLNLNNNYFASFTKLPKTPNLRTLLLCDNSIKSLDGLQNLRKSRLEVLDLRRNPISFQECYRQSVFKVLPDLRELDGIPRLISDIEGGFNLQNGCTVS
ncbi:uncharacterized protein LOC110978978 isoform X2 [Acanthaster planci]|nr:uncharacterized protein LOC110978978 isoform X2 [Acanthaster planci]